MRIYTIILFGNAHVPNVTPFSISGTDPKDLMTEATGYKSWPKEQDDIAKIAEEWRLWLDTDEDDPAPQSFVWAGVRITFSCTRLPVTKSKGKPNPYPRPEAGIMLPFWYDTPLTHNARAYKVGYGVDGWFEIDKGTHDKGLIAGLLGLPEKIEVAVTHTVK